MKGRTEEGRKKNPRTVRVRGPKTEGGLSLTGHRTLAYEIEAYDHTSDHERESAENSSCRPRGPDRLHGKVSPAQRGRRGTRHGAPGCTSGCKASGCERDPASRDARGARAAGREARRIHCVASLRRVALGVKGRRGEKPQEAHAGAAKLTVLTSTRALMRDPASTAGPAEPLGVLNGHLGKSRPASVQRIGQGPRRGSSSIPFGGQYPALPGGNARCPELLDGCR